MRAYVRLLSSRLGHYIEDVSIFLMIVLATIIHTNIMIDMVIYEKRILLLHFFHPLQSMGIFAS